MFMSGAESHRQFPAQSAESPFAISLASRVDSRPTFLKSVVVASFGLGGVECLRGNAFCCTL